MYNISPKNGYSSRSLSSGTSFKKIGKITFCLDVFCFYSNSFNSFSVHSRPMNDFENTIMPNSHCSRPSYILSLMLSPHLILFLSYQISEVTDFNLSTRSSTKDCLSALACETKTSYFLKSDFDCETLLFKSVFVAGRYISSYFFLQLLQTQANYKNS